MKRLISIVACLLLAAPAAAAPQGPLETLKAQDARIKKSLEGVGDAVPPARRDEVAETINALIDFPELARRSLRDHWDTVEAAKRDEFVSLLTHLIKDASVKKLGIYKAEVNWDDTQVTGDEAEVITFVDVDEEEIEVIYRLHQKGGGWMVYDLEIDGISTVEDYRATFNKEIGENGFDSLLQKLRDKRDGKDTGETAAAPTPAKPAAKKSAPPSK